MQPNAVRVLWSILRVLATVRRPDPTGTDVFDHRRLALLLGLLAEGGLDAVAEDSTDLDSYLASVAEAHPDDMSRDEALAFWLDVYNAGAIRMAIEAIHQGLDSVLRLPGGFSHRFAVIDGEHLSLDAIEHAKIRRFGDPRIHAALVCGSASCPSVRHQPFQGEGLDRQLDDQMHRFITKGGAVPGIGGGVAVNRIFLWYGGDFVRPHRMPTLIPATRKAILEALRPWLPPDLAGAETIEFQRYDWALGCSVG